MIKAWEFDFNEVTGMELPDYQNQDVVQDAFNRNLELLASLEKRGFEGIFHSEHHFISGMSPCPNLLLAALATKTKTLKMGVMGNVLGFHQPWRLAEELHMLDYITNGRLEYGLAVGIPPEFELLDVDPAEIRTKFAEIREYLEKAQENRFVTVKGKHFDLDAIPCMPRPRKEERRRHWMTIYSESSCRSAARSSYKVCTGFQSCEKAAAAFDGYRDEADKHGIDVGPDDIGLRRLIMIADTQSDAEGMIGDLMSSMMVRLNAQFKTVYERAEAKGKGMSEGQKASGVMDADVVPSGDAGIKTKSGGDEIANVMSPEEVIIGSPEGVAEQIIDQCRRIGAGNILGYHPASMTYDQLYHNYDLWEKVIPILKKADI